MIRISEFPRRFCTASKQRYLSSSVPLLSRPFLSTSKSNIEIPCTTPYPLSSSSFSLLLSRSKSTAILATNLNKDDWYTSSRTAVEKNAPGQLADSSHKLISLPLPNLSEITREETLDYLENIWSLHDELFSSLQHNQEAFIRPPNHGLRHPMIFYYGHTTVFYINKLKLAGVLSHGLNEYFEEIFEVGVDEMSWDDMSKNEMEWPSLESVTEYRREVYEIVRDVILTHSELEDTKSNPITQASALWSLFMSFEHDRIHLETSSVLLREMPLDLLARPSFLPPLHPSAESTNSVTEEPIEDIDYPKASWLEHAGGTVTLGKDADYPSFGWDNEYGSLSLTVQPFKVQTTMVTNGDFYHFVNSDGYKNPEYWSEDGWGWKEFRNVTHPTFWTSGTKLRTMFEEIDMPWDWPVEVNHHEAAAYCKWKAVQDNVPLYHLMTEAIHALLRKDDVIDSVMTTSSSERFKEYNLNMAYSSPSPVKAYPKNTAGVYDIMGNVWELGEDRFCPLPGFKIHDLYHDFSTPCFDNRHSMLFGGSFFSSGDNGASSYSRYHFRDHFHQFSGFRLVMPKDSTATTKDIVKSSTEQEKKGIIIN